jgi:hypothetical protein
MDAFIVWLAVPNQSLKRVDPTIPTRGDTRTEIAHSDQSPETGHDIYVSFLDFFVLTGGKQMPEWDVTDTQYLSRLNPQRLVVYERSTTVSTIYR